MANRSVDSDGSFADGDISLDPDRRVRKRSLKSKPFYEVPADKPTSSQIINESKSWLLKSVRTERPFTPRDARRLLFADRSGSADLDESTSRPSSGITFDSGEVSRPVSSVTKRLAPLNHVPEVNDAAGYEYDAESSRALPHSGVLLPHPPAANSAVATPTRLRHRRHSLTRPSADNDAKNGAGSQPSRPSRQQVVPREQLVTATMRSGSASSNDDHHVVRRFSSSSTDAERDYSSTVDEAGRRVQSGPKERSAPYDSGVPRAHSASSNNATAKRVEDESSASAAGGVQSSTSSAATGRPPAAPNHPGRRKDATSTTAKKTQRSSRREEPELLRQRSDASGSSVELGGSDSSLSTPSKHNTAEHNEQAAVGNSKTNDFEGRVTALLADLEHARGARDIESLLSSIDALRRTLESANELGRHCSMRIVILKALFAVLDTNEPRVQLRTSHLVLALRVSGNNLVNISRLIFRISKDERNDVMFLEESVLEQLVAIVTQYSTYLSDSHAADCHCVSADASNDTKRPTSSKNRPNNDLLVYTVGCMRFLGGQNELARELVSLGAFEALASLVTHMLLCCSRLVDSIVDSRADSRLSSASADVSTQPPSIDPAMATSCVQCPQMTFSSATSVLIQVVGCIRNFLERNETRPLCVSSTILDDFCELLECFANSYEVILGVCRVLSKVSQFGEACHLLLRFRSSRSRTPLGSTLIQHLVRHRKQQDLVVRIAFVLGNLATRVSSEQHDEEESESDAKRMTVFQSKRELTEFLTVLRYYVEHDRKRSGETELDRGVYEVLVKLVRVLANASLDERTGKMIADSKTCLKLIICLIERTEPTGENEELLLNAISAINNLSYYMISGDASAFQERQIIIAQKMLPLLESEQPELITETVRVFGNLSRERSVRDLIVERKMDRVLLSLLETNDTELIYCTMGVLLNLMNDTEKRRILKHENGVGVARLLRLLESVLPDDWYTASLICKTLWNFTDSLPVGSISAAIGGANETRRLYEVLTAFGDEQFVRSRIAQASSRRAKPNDHDAESAQIDDEDADVQQASEWQFEIWRSEFCLVAQALAQRISQAAAASRTQQSAPQKSK